MQRKWAGSYPSDLIERARRQSDTARQHLDNLNYPECISCCIESIELFLKAASLLVEGHYPQKHIDSWTDEEIANVIRKIPSELENRINPEIANFPRLFLLASFWGEFYNIARYGQEEFKIGPNRLFTKPEAELAFKHSQECWMKVSMLKNYLNQEQKKED